MADPVTKERAPAKKRTRYEDDYYTWVNEQVALLRERRFAELDVENVAEELGDLGKSETAKLWSILRVVVMHMQRKRYHKLLKQSPSLKASQDEILADAYDSARDWAANETNLPEDEFPQDCPYSWDDILARPFETDRKNR
jgi:Domain of unknown function DUF29